MTAVSAPEAPAVKKSTRQLRYMAQSVQLEEMGISAMSRGVVLVIAGLVFAFMVYASFLVVDEVTVTFGSIVPRSSVHVVQHLEGGILREIMVEERQMVEEGEPVARLDPVQAMADLDQTRARQVALSLHAERLRAFVENRDPNFATAPLRLRHLVDDQRDLLRASRERWVTQRQVIEGEIAQKTQEIAAVADQMAATRRQIALLRDEEAMRKDMFERQLTTKGEFFAVRRQLAGMESELHRLEGQSRTAEEAVAELGRRLEDLDNNVRQDALGELGTVAAELAQVEEALARATDRADRLTLFAPVRGFVQNLQAKNVGAVVPAGGVLMEIVPVDDELQAETKVSTRDVGHLREGQPVSIKVSSFDFVRYGDITGTLRSVSASTYVDEKTGEAYYRAKIDLDHSYVKKPENAVIPGMTVQADIVTGHKTLAEYLLKPIFVSLAQSFRER